MIFAAGFVLLAWIVLLLSQGFIVNQFGLGGDGRAIVFWFATLIAPFFIFNGALFISNASFNNLKRPVWSTLLNWGRNTIGIAPFVILGAQWGGAPGVVIGQAMGGIFFGMLGLWLAYRLVAAYRDDKADPDTPWRPPFWPARPKAL